MDNRYSEFKRYVMNIDRYGELLREVDEDAHLNGGNVLGKVERLEEQRCERTVEWEERDFTFIAQNPNIYQGTLLHAASVAGCGRVARALLEAGVDVGAKCLRGFTPLHTAAENGETEMVGHLIENGANIREVDNKGCTPLHLSAAFGSPETVAALLASGADVNATDEDQNTPLLLAVNAKENVAETVRILLDRGADIDARDGSGNTVLHRTILKIDNTVVLEGYLTDYEVNAFDQAAEIVSLNKARYTEDVMELLLDRGAGINERNHAEDTPLHCAIKYSSLEVLSLLIERGADVNAGDGRLCTPLYRACDRQTLSRKECFEITKLLIENGADINAVGSEGIATLHSIIEQGWINLAVSVIGLCLLDNPEACMPGYIQGNYTLSYYWQTIACKARNELQTMSTIKAWKGLTFRDILFSGNINRLASYLQNKKIPKIFRKRSRSKYFPLYGANIVNRFDKGKKRLKLLIAAEESVVKLFYISTDHRKMLPHHIAREIAHYLSNKDIRRLTVTVDDISVDRRKRPKLATRFQSTLRHF